MSQSDNSLFFILIRSLFLITTFGFGVCLVHFFYQNVSKIKVGFNFSGKVVASDKKLSPLVIIMCFSSAPEWLIYLLIDWLPVPGLSDSLWDIFIVIIISFLGYLPQWIIDWLIQMLHDHTTIDELIALLRAIFGTTIDIDELIRQLREIFGR